MSTILIVGGYGNTGYYVAELLLQHTDARVIVAGRNERKARAAAERLRARYGKDVAALQLDAGAEDPLRAAFARCDLAVFAASTHEHLDTIVRAALDTRTDYLDTQLSIVTKLDTLRRSEQAFAERGMTVITDAGFHPGLPAALVRHAALRFDELKTANVGSYIGIPWNEIEASGNTMGEFAEELLHFQPKIFLDGTWQTIPFRELTGTTFDFGGEVGEQTCMPMYMHELDALPKLVPSLQETGFFIAGFDWFTNNVATMVAMLGARVGASRLAGRFFFWSAKTFAQPPFVTVLQLEASGTQAGVEQKLTIRLSHEDSYWFTAIPVVACIQQYMKGTHDPGLHFQAQFLEAEGLVRVLSELGIESTIEEGE